MLARFAGTTGASVHPPLVDTWCFCGANLSTTLGYRWAPGQSLAQAPSAEIQVAGDGNQEAQTNSACRVWQRTNVGHAFAYREFPGVEHFAMTIDKAVLGAVLDVLRAA